MGEINRFASRRVAMICGGMLLAAACGLPGSAALAQSAGSAIDQPTPGTLPPGTSTTKGAGGGNMAGSGGVEPPSAIRSSTDVMSGGDVQGGKPSGRTDPAEHLPKSMR